MRCAVCLALIGVSLHAQGPLRFEVASIKLRPPEGFIRMVGGVPSGPRLHLEAMSLADLIAWAYDIKTWQVTGGPSWSGVKKDRSVLDAGARRFDIDAKAEGDGQRSMADFRRMLQTLLAERFQLTLRQESREMQVYALVVSDKNGPKFHESPPEAPGYLVMRGPGKITSSGGTMAQLANWFSNGNGVERPVLDDTGLQKRYDFTLEWTNGVTAAADAPTGPSVFTAMTEQLGLKLEPRRAPVDVWVIDRAELPGDN